MLMQSMPFAFAVIVLVTTMLMGVWAMTIHGRPRCRRHVRFQG